jgi:hypothetical protein
MAWGYIHDDGTQLGFWLALVMQVLLFATFVSPKLRQLQRLWSPLKLTAIAVLTVTGSTLVFHALFPVFRGGSLTAALLTLLVVLPISLVNSVVFAVRLAIGPARSLLGLFVIAINLVFWAWALSIALS